MIQELDMVVLTRDVDAHGLKRGDLGAVVHEYSKEGFEVEFSTAEGRTVAVLTLKEEEIRPLHVAGNVPNYERLVVLPIFFAESGAKAVFKVKRSSIVPRSFASDL
jgi:hypothetical protein